MLKRLLFKLAKGPLMGKIVRAAFQYCSWAIPVKKLYNSREIIAFYHPRPSYEKHIIISPKRAVRDLQQMASAGLDKYFSMLWETVKDICETHPEYNDSFVLVANGGKRQEVGQVHFHMFTNHEVVQEYFAGEQEESVFYSDKDIRVLEHPDPNWEIHFMVWPGLSSQMEDRYFRSFLSVIGLLDVELNIVQRGYSLVYQYDKQKSDMECPVFHVVSGKKIK